MGRSAARSTVGSAVSSVVSGEDRTLVSAADESPLLNEPVSAEPASPPPLSPPPPSSAYAGVGAMMACASGVPAPAASESATTAATVRLRQAGRRNLRAWTSSCSRVGYRSMAVLTRGIGAM